MVLRSTYLNKIRDLNYTLFNETKRVQIYRKKGSNPPHYITVPKCDKLEDDFVRSSLGPRQAGMSQADVASFLALHSC